MSTNIYPRRYAGEKQIYLDVAVEVWKNPRWVACKLGSEPFLCLLQTLPPRCPLGRQSRLCQNGSRLVGKIVPARENAFKTSLMDETCSCSLVASLMRFLIIEAGFRYFTDLTIRLKPANQLLPIGNQWQNRNKTGPDNDLHNRSYHFVLLSVPQPGGHQWNHFPRKPVGTIQLYSVSSSFDQSFEHDRDAIWQQTI